MPITETIDAHHHLWRYTPANYAWIDDPMAALRRDFLPADLDIELAAAHVDGTVAIQARQTLEETNWLLALARHSPTIRGIVGWAPLADDHIEATLDTFAREPKLKGLRHVVQAEPPGFLDGHAFNRGIRALTARNLAYDILILANQLEEAIRFVDRHPSQTFVLDHIAKPNIATQQLEPWRTHIRELARRDNVSCKLSGLVTEDVWSSWSLTTLQPFLETVVEAFTPTRLMAASDWPVCLVATSYTGWWEVLRTYFASYSCEEQSQLFGATASRIYQL
jgi:L-fuconolactonase